MGEVVVGVVVVSDGGEVGVVVGIGVAVGVSVVGMGEVVVEVVVVG